jgi:ATP-dependent Clp protease, protease subunit
MAGNHISMADNAMMMIHPAQGLVMGNAEEMRKVADMMEKLDGTISGTYAKRTKKDEEEIKALMSAETWMNAQDALDNGFVDEITGALELAACFDLSKFKYRNAPEKVQAPKGDNRFDLARLNLAAQRIKTASGQK